MKIWKPGVLLDTDYVVAARDAGFSDSMWRAMFYETGPYDITVPTQSMRKFVELIRERFPGPTPADGEA